MATDDLFRPRLDQLIDLRNPLAEPATRVPWAQIEASLAREYAHRDRQGRPIEGADLFGPSPAVADAGVSNVGRAAPSDPPDGVPAVPQARLQR